MSILFLDQRVVYTFLQQINDKSVEKPVEKQPAKDLNDVLDNLKKWVRTSNMIFDLICHLDIKHVSILLVHEVNSHVCSNHQVGVWCVNLWERIGLRRMVFQLKIRTMAQYLGLQIEECALLFWYIPIGSETQVFRTMNIIDNKKTRHFSCIQSY